MHKRFHSVEEAYATANVGALPWQSPKWQEEIKSLSDEEGTYRLQTIVNLRSFAMGHGDLPIGFFAQHKHGMSLPLRQTGVLR
jgi:hypothetical protein